MRVDVQESTPTWAREALAVPVGSAALDLAESGRDGQDGVRIAYREWGAGDDRGVLLLHGGRAHARWWDFVAPLLDGRHVVAMDVSGHGDTSERSSYGLDGWIEEVTAVVDRVFTSPPVVIGHSMGGAIAMLAAPGLDDRIRATVAIDSLLGRTEDLPAPPAVAPLRLAGTREELMARFRLIPDDGAAPPWMLHYVGYHSIRGTGDRFRWKFDPRIGAMEWPEEPTRITPSTPVVYYRCEFGLARAATLRSITDLFSAADLRVRELGGVGHNPMLDTPRELAAELCRVLAELEE